MGRSSNDDRSDSLNPNNDSYSASESNRSNQIGDDDENDYSRKIQRIYSHIPSPKITRTKYVFAILDFNGMSRFASFHTVTSDQLLSPKSNEIAASVFYLYQRWLSDACQLGIAYARLWGPSMNYLPKFTWYEGCERIRFEAWDSSLRKIAQNFESKLEQENYQDSEYLGEFSVEVDFDSKNPRNE